MTSLNIVNVTATSSGLTTATTAYTAGDVLGALMSWDMTSASGVILGAVLTDISDIIGAVDLFLFNGSITTASVLVDNAVPGATNDTDILKALGKIEFPAPDDLGGARVASVDSLAVPWNAASGTTIYGLMVTRTGHTFFGAATALQVRLIGSKDA